MRIRLRWYLLLLALLALVAAVLFFYGGAHAQAPGGYDCDVTLQPSGAFDAHCEPEATNTPPSTATTTATATPLPPTNTPTAQPTETATLPPPTATATPTAPAPTVTPVPAGALRLNVPLLDAAAGAPELDANNWSILWAGDISPDGGYTQARLVGMRDGLRVYVQQMTPSLTGAQFGLAVNGRRYTVTPSSAGWGTANRCGADGCRGWSASRAIPWADLGGLPDDGDVWPLTLQGGGNAWDGTLHWGLPDYAGTAAAGAQVSSVQVAADASLGGGTDCGDDDYPDYFPTWGSRNYGKFGGSLVSLGAIAYTNVQNQWDTADWPCYARYAAKWPMLALPEGAQVVSATLSLYKFGHSGYAGEPTGTNIMQVWEASPDWTEAGISWDNSPDVWENVSRLPVGECAAANCQPGEWHAFDVTEIVKRAVDRGDSEAAALLYTAAGQYHSGRYFYTREGSVKPVVRVAYTLQEEPTAWPSSPTPTIATSPATSTPSATSTHAPTSPSVPTTTTTATASPVSSATPTPSPTSVSTATASPTSQPQTDVPRIAIMGDSFFDEYRADNNRGGAYAATTLNMVEILQRLSGFDLGPWGTWGGTRRTGYENNCALSGATSDTMVSGKQPQCVAAIVAAGKADYVLVGIGANDFSPSFGDTYQRIYSGAMTDAELNAKVARAVQDVTTGVDAALGAGARGVLVVSFTQWGLDPSVAKRFPNAAGRQRVDDAIGRVNGGLEAMAAAREGVVIIDQNAIGRDLILPRLDSAGNFTVGGEKIAFLTNGDEPHHAKLGDGAHLGTVMGGWLANHYFVEPLNENFGFSIAPLGEAEMLNVAGIKPAGGTPTWTTTPTATYPSYTPTPSPSLTAAPQTPTSTATTTATSTSPTWTPTAASATSTLTTTPAISPSATPTSPAQANGCTRTVSPGGLAAAVAALKAGDTLCLRDGTYYETFVPRTNGTASAPITVRALNDGKATIDGQGVRKTVDLQRDWWVIEGIVARNGTDNVFRVDGSNNVLRRVSAYDASTDINSAVIMLLGANNLVEDALVAGTGRYMAEVYKGSGNTLRRVFTMWAGWDGRQFCGVAWPNGNNIGVYNASNTTVENVIAYGRSLKGIMVQANSNNAVADNNHVLGSMSVLQGRNYDGSVWNYGSYPNRPGPTSCTGVLDLNDGGDRVGFILFGQGTLTNNVFRDVLAVDNVGLGFDAHRPYTSGAVGGNVIERATFTGNGAQLAPREALQGGNIYLGLPGVDVRDSRIPNAPLAQGGGAQLQMYVNRQPTGAPLTPWPMESRALAELGVSVDAVIEEYAAR